MSYLSAVVSCSLVTLHLPGVLDVVAQRRALKLQQEKQKEELQREQQREREFERERQLAAKPAAAAVAKQQPVAKKQEDSVT